MSNHITSDFDLINVIKSAEENDLAILADFITDNNKGRISLDSSIRSQIDTFKRNKSAEIQLSTSFVAMGLNTVKYSAMWQIT